MLKFPGADREEPKVRAKAIGVLGERGGWYVSQRSWEAGWEALRSYLATGSLLPSTGACGLCVRGRVCVYGCPQQRLAADQVEAQEHSMAPSHAQSISAVPNSRAAGRTGPAIHAAD